MTHIEKIHNTDFFCLHDSKVSNIEFVDHNLVLTFSEGYWKVNEQGKLFQEMKDCKITYKFLMFEDEDLNLDIFKETRRKRKETKFKEFSYLVKKYGFMIYREFRCVFTSQLILEGTVQGKGIYAIFMDEIDEIIYECNA